MIIVKQASTLARYIEKEKKEGKIVGFVPTLGALHQGHMTLIGQCRQSSDFTVVSIFVNPTQFNNISDYRKYPHVIEKDIALLATAGVDMLFLPPLEEIYPNGTEGLETYDLGYLETVLEGKYRPGHFQGVCQVMQRLLNMVTPHKLFMGLKDYQQCMVVRRLLHIMESDIAFIGCDTVREPDGLAMSSRNLRLSETERKKAATIYETLQMVNNELEPGDLRALKQKAVSKLEQAGFKVDYVEIADANSLEIVDSWDGKEPLVALAAAFIGEVRLIDNIVLKLL
jgi:pantoate--beta-alanine ligase